jgi:glycosyltransferase involved in cell wall biosynthesis
MRKYQSSLVIVSVSNVPVDGRVIRSAIALASSFDCVRVIGFTRNERQPPEISNLQFDLFLLNEHTKSSIVASLARKFLRLRILIRIAWRLLASRADVYYSHEAHLLPVAWLAARIRRAKLVYDIHEIYGETGTGLASHILRLIESPLIHACDVLITTNIDRSKEIARKNYIEPSKINVIRNLPIISPCPQSVLDVFKQSTSLKCIYHGRLSLSDRALDVLVSVVASMPGIELAIVGIDSLGQRAVLEKIANQALYKNVFFVEPVSPDQLVAFSAGADIGILPYRNIGTNTALASPNKIWEYIASGLFVLSTPFPEARRIFNECPCGTVADISDAGQLRYQLLRIMNMSDLESKKQASKNYFEKNISWTNEAKQLQNAICSMFSP